MAVSLVTGYRPARFRKVEELTRGLPNGAVLRVQLTRLDDLRKAAEWAGRRSLIGSGDKAVVVWELGGPSVQNALLKFIEEPPLGVSVVLNLPDATKVIETVRSRCVNYHFPVPEFGEVVSDLMGGGASAGRAAKTALLMERGLEETESPSDDDVQFCQRFIAFCRDRNYESMLDLLDELRPKSFEQRALLAARGSRSLVALREFLAKGTHLEALAATYGHRDATVAFEAAYYILTGE